jgi:ABC-2 type transport system permease protein
MKNEKINSPTLAILKRELHRIADRKTLYILSIILPIILFTIFASIYKFELVHKVPVAICDQDHSETSRLIIRYIESTSSMTNVINVNSISEIKAQFLKGNIQGAFFIPEHMESSLKNGKSTGVILFKGTTNLVTSNYIYNDGVKIIKMVSAGAVRKKLLSAGLKEDQAMNILSPIRVQTQILFNPNYSYENYLTPGLLTVILQMIIMVVAVLLISSEITHNTFRELTDLAGGRIFPVLIGKSIPHLCIHSATALMILGVFFTLFNIPILGSVLYTVLFLLFFVIVSFFYGFAIGTVFPDQQMATEVALFINTPAFIFSGYTFPLWGMPEVHQLYAQTIPYTHFLTGFLKIYQMNAPIKYALPETLKLSVFLVVSFIVIMIMLKIRMRKSLAIPSQEEPNNE